MINGACQRDDSGKREQVKMLQFFILVESSDLVNSANLHNCDNSSFDYMTLGKSALKNWGVGMEVRDKWGFLEG